MMDTPNPQPEFLNQKQRWLKYGLNVGVLIVAVLLILFIVNFMAFRHRQRLDFTHNRRYTLSPQTLRLLDRLDRGVTITTLYRDTPSNAAEAEKLAQVDTLLAEYRLRGRNIDVRRIDPVLNVAAYEKFTQELMGRFAQDIDKRRQAVAQTRQVIAQLRPLLDEQPQVLPMLAEAMKDNAAAVEFIGELQQAFASMATQLPAIERAVEKQAGGELPDFESIRPLIAPPGQQFSLRLYSTGLLEPAITRFTIFISRDAPQAARDQLLALRDKYREVNEQITRLVETVSAIESGRYEELRADLLAGNCVVIALDDAKPGPEAATDAGSDRKGVSVLTVDDLYPQFISSEEAGQGPRPEQAYKGEEAITSALFKLTLKHNTRVVFVNSGMEPMLQRMSMRDPGGSYQLVAERLRAMNFQVEEWQPGGGMQFGRPTPPQPKPVASEGQTLIFIALPPPFPHPQMPFNPAEGPAREAVMEHIEAGRPTLVMTNPTTALEATAQADPVLQALGGFGLEVERQKLILRPLPGQEKGGIYEFLDAMPAGDHPIAQAVRGLPGRFLLAQPVKLAAPPEGVKHWPLLQSGRGTWADTDAWPFSREKMLEVTRENSEAGGPILFAAAAEKDKHRVVVVAEPVWASDFNTAQTQLVARDLSLQSISLFTLFPANADLFINSVYWLAGLDDLIAPGAKSQETRRIQDVSYGTISTLRWLLLAGLPVACLGAGVVVWFVRRK